MGSGSVCDKYIGINGLNVLCINFSTHEIIITNWDVYQYYKGESSLSFLRMNKYNGSYMPMLFLLKIT